ncbi:septation protein IspZ [Pseudoalteromonas luteoviolacea]|uniref:inner membrane-spanning protein YciB n=1 Tax=Pseudoalteromonas TaxID=53246 RepID=UPI001F21B4AF|nr:MULTISPECIES: inner membrane-spanning protein YciB [Pseudoalteromonas]MCF6441144.1 septation protein IspZ [Pseudoalteromonas luteoviolacea]MDK1289909.1 inner membrane-spanning protein YciB [Pseudoalteromonas sp. B95]
MAFIVEYLPLILFFLVYKFMDIFWATGVLIVASLIQMAWQYFKEGAISQRHWIFFAIALLLGGLTILFQDEQFIMWKATIIYAALGSTLLVSHHMLGKNLTKKALLGILNSAMKQMQHAEQSDNKVPKRQKAEELPIPETLFAQLNLAWSALFFVIAILNLIVAYTFSLDFWVNFKVFGLMAITFIAVMLTIAKVSKYLPEDE